MRAIAYRRVSTEEQAESGLGLEAQLHACEQWAARQNCPLIGPFTDDCSGAAPLHKRPGLLDALASLTQGDTLLVAKRDRLGRDPIVIAMIESACARKGCRIISCAGEGTADDEPGSVLMRRMIDAFAEYERLIIMARTRAALNAKRRRGERVGQIPYGSTLRTDGQLIPDPRESEGLQTIQRLVAEGLSLRQIASELTALGYTPKQGGPGWHHSSVARIMRRLSTTGR